MAVIDRERLLKYLRKRAQEAGVGSADEPGALLALYAAYEGVANMIQNGDFDRED